MTIYVALLDEGTAVWCPVEATAVAVDAYRIDSVNAAPEDERWEYQHGDIVVCESHEFSDGLTALVAVGRTTGV